jgi:methylmalonyl-CoA mutase
VSEHPDVREQRLSRPKPDPVKLRAAAATRLVAWRRDHRCDQALGALARAAGDPARQPGELMAAAVRAAREGATIGQMTAAWAAASAGAEPAWVEPLAVRTYAAAYEELRIACDAYVESAGRRPQVFLANWGTPAEFIARSTYAQNFFQAGGFQEVNNDGFSEMQALAAAFAGSEATIAVICSTDKNYESIVDQVAPKLKAAGARTVILAGNPGANEAKYRAAGVDRFIFLRCDVLGTLRSLLHEEGVLP